MAQRSVPLSMLLTKDVSYEWHDGVALIAQLVAQVRSDIPKAQTRIPDLRAVTLEENGSLTLSADPSHSMPAMPGAAQILQQLLSGKEQPPPLRLFAMQAATAEPTPTLDSFADELAKWERPNRQAKLSALYFRALEQIGTAALTEEARAREERILNAQQQVAPPAPVAPKRKKAPARDPNASGRQQTVGVVIILLALIVGGAAWYLRGRPLPAFIASSGLISTEAPADEKEAPGADAGANPPATSAQAPRRRTPRTPSVDNAESEMARARELFQRQEYSAAGVAFDRVIELLGTESSPQAEEVRQIARSLAEVARAATADQAEAALREYRAGDPGVTDPVPLAYLPPKPDPNTPPDLLQVREVHVNASGTVDSARFVMNRPSFRNSWWTAAAKAWRFTPAMKDGKPVRYVMRIVMDDTAAER